VNVLIIGGTRFVGHFTALALREAGHEVTVFTRGLHPIDLPEDILHMKGDRNVDSNLASAATATDWDVVWDNMSYTADQARSAVRAFDGRCSLFIHTSTLAVYSACEGIVSPYREDDFGRGRPMLERREIYPYDYGIQRREGEEVLQGAHEANGFPFVSIRLPAVLGPRDYSLRAWSYWRRMLEDRRIILPDGGIEMHRSVYCGDVVEGLLAIIERGPELAGNAYNLAGREIVSLRHFINESAAVLGVDVEIVDLPRSALEAADINVDKLSPYTTWGDHLEAIAKAQHQLEFQPTPMDQWLAPTIEWHLEHRRDADPPGWDLRDKEHDLAARWAEFLGGLG
jgi:nucleoside-diphosphate-sugar epimerase